MTLEGLVRNEAEKRMAECDAWYVFGVDNVINRLTGADGSHMQE
jgi:osmotically-inducible protein OsmY